MSLNQPIYCLLKDWYRKHNKLTLTMIKNKKIEKWHNIQSF